MTIPHAYPLYVENRAGQQRFFRLTIDLGATASFNYASFDPLSPDFGKLDREADIAIGPYSTVTGSVVVGPGQANAVLITVEQVQSRIENGKVVSTGVLQPGGVRTTVTLNTAGDAAAAVTEAHTPVVAPTPDVSFPFRGRLPITIPAGSLFTQSPFSQTSFEQNPFSQTPFSQTPFSQTVTIYEVTDVNFKVTVDGTDAAAYAALLAVRNSFQAQGNYLFQVLINRLSSTMALDGCKAVDRARDMQVSNIVAPFDKTPFSQTPFSQTVAKSPFSQTPFSQTPFSQTPFSQTPFSQTADPRDPAVSNSSFYVAPVVPSAPDYRAARRVDTVIYTLRAWQIVPTVLGNTSLFDTNGNVQVGVTVVANTPPVKVVNGQVVYDPGGPPASSGGAAVPVRLAFVTQPRSTVPGATIAPSVQVVVLDAFNQVVTGSQLPVTLTIGNNPSGSTLGGTTTRPASVSNGIATFPGLSINNAGAGYTLVASSGTLEKATSLPFDVLPLSVTVAQLFDGIQGTPYPPTPQALHATGGTPPYTWSRDTTARVNNGAGPVPAILPPGLVLNASTGVISGLATTAGEFSFRVIVQDAVGRTAAENFCIHIDPNLGANLLTVSIQEGATVQSLAASLIDPDDAGVVFPPGSAAIFTGSSNAGGRFTGGGGATQGVGFDRGLILSTGSVGGAIGPNDRTNMSVDPLGTFGDADLAALAGTTAANTVDAAILEFDFIPECHVGETCHVTFEYVFGSDEYNEYANREFNDVFGFFLRDVTPGFETANKNYAVLPLPAPNNNIPVAINNVNGGSTAANGGYALVDSDPGFPSPAVNPQFFRNNRTATNLPDPTDGPSGTLNVQADGLTVPLQFNAPVVSGHRYHIKLGITDVSDGLFDSWVFIKSGTFKVTHICPIIVVP
jgi:hypothetical protein